MFTALYIIYGMGVLSHCIIVDICIITLICAMAYACNDVPTDEELEEWARLHDTDDTIKN